MQTNFNLRWRRKSARLFVTRHAARGRRLENLDALAQRFERLGFTVVDTERMSAVEQAALFSRAKVVVGVMGAAMTNTIFCASDARVIHFAPEGWLEPYYWDLASNLGHEYNACYGPPIRTEGPAHMTAFELPEHLVSKALTLAQ
jgi:capsular polysaccharide biosynthesis protein